MIMRRPYSRPATRRAHRFKIRESPRPQPGRLNDKMSLGFDVGLDRGRLSRAGSAVALEVPRPGAPMPMGSVFSDYP